MGMGWLWLIGAVVAGGGAYLLGWPAWSTYRAREARETNTERYLAWRGRADRSGTASMREGMTGRERRNLWLAAALGAVALACLVAFFVAT